MRRPPTITKDGDPEGPALKKSKHRHLSPILFVRLKVPHGKKNRQFKTRTIKALVDSGATESIINKNVTKHLVIVRNKKPKCWTTAAGLVETSTKTKATFSLPELHANREVTKSLHIVDTGLSRYKMIIGRDLITKLGLDVRGSDLSISWDEGAIPWRDMDTTEAADAFLTVDQSPQPFKREVNRMTGILEAKYKKADLKKIASDATHLTNGEQKALYNLLDKYENLFDGTLGTWNGTPYDIKLKKDAEPSHARPFPVPKIHELTMKSELDRLIKLGVLKKVNRSEWGAPTFIIPKKDNTVRFISDFRELNKRIRQQPYPIPKIQDLLIRLEGFKYGTSLDLNMGYYHIELSAKSKELCTIVTQWGKYEYQRLPMGLCNSPDIFQEKMSELLAGLDTVRVYLDDILHVTKGSWEDHLAILEKIFIRLQEAGLKVNAKKSSFGAHDLEYLGYKVTREGIMPIADKVKAI